MLKNKNIIEKMTLEEKVSLCAGSDYWHTQDIERLSIPKIMMSDGPHGLRVQKKKADNLGVNESDISTCFPSEATIANSWNKKLIYKMAEALGEECLEEGVSILLGPGVNIKRSPLCGRNFEYFSEDPYFSGIMGTEYVKGLQSKGIGSCVKHFAANNQENRRRTIDAIVDDRTLKEIYLKPFEMIVKNAKPWAVMSAYNKLNGKYCTENEKLLGILKKDWNFEGIVITDWGAENDRVSGLIAGNELEMPGKRGNGKEEIKNAIEKGSVKEEYLDSIIDRTLDVIFKSDENRKEGYTYNKEKHHDLAREIAEESIVLLKNNEEILPINKNKKIALIGDMVKNPRYQGSGSSTINPYKLENVYDVLKEKKIEFEYAQGYERSQNIKDKELRRKAIEIAKDKDYVIVFAGLTENYESEGMDRKTLDIPENQNKLINEISKVNSNIIVILAGGSPMLMPWRENVKAIVATYLSGEAGAEAIVNIITGKTNPSGKLAETYPLRLQDTPSYKNFPGNEVTVEYQESIYVGYRYYDKVKKEVLFPFGYGLSYTSFEYSNLEIKENEGEYILNFKIKNIGEFEGKEIIQIYVSQRTPKIFKAEKELKGFTKVNLRPGESRDIKIKIDTKAFEYYNPETKKWNIEEGIYDILVASSSKDIRLKDEIQVKSNDQKIQKDYPEVYYSGNVHEITDNDYEIILGHKIPPRELDLKNITEENTIEQVRKTLIGGAIYYYQKNIVMKRLLKEQNTNKATKVMMDLQKPLKKYYEKKNGKYTEEQVKGFIDMLNGHWIKGYKRIKRAKK